MSIIAKLKPKLLSRTTLLVLVVVLIGVYWLFFREGSEPATDLYAVVESVERGTVSSGIKTSGTIMAAQKLDLDVYKQARRIESVNVTNASHVPAGTILFSFDKSGAYVAVESSRVALAEAQLALATKQANYGDANTALTTSQNNLVTLRADIVEAEKDLVQAKRDFLNANRTAEPGNEVTEDKARPALSGLYNGTEEGTYRIELYRSGAESGYSYRVSGLESGTKDVIVGIPTPIGSRGLEVTFSTDIKTGDVWVISIPNFQAPEFFESKENYDARVLELETLIASKRVEIANTEIDIKNQTQTDAVPYRNLDIAKAEATLSEAAQQLSENYDVVQEQNIVAPFAGTVEGLENVVVGATPTGNTNDSISLGTLISDEFIVTFSLSAVDVAKVAIGQKVLVSVTSFPGVLPLEASITEVSSLPESEGVAQYEVQALISTSTTSTLKLREGLLAAIEVVENEVLNVMRVPLSAITYENGQASVEVVGDLLPEQQSELSQLGVIKAVGGVFPSYSVPVTVGVTGTFFAEITNGLEEGMQIIVTKTEPQGNVIEQDSFGPPDRSEERNTTEPASPPAS